jgi:glutamate-1-semialdehyde 2,1-aminomutase
MVAPYRDWHTADAFSGEPDPVLGLPPDAGHVLAWDGRDLNVLSSLLKANENGVAGLIVDPVQLREPIAQNLRGIRELTREYDVLLILDELKTGLRTGLSGVQGRYGVWADIVVLGKAIANGLPLAIVLGPDWAIPLIRKSKLKGTYNSELGSIAAAIATIKEFERLGGVQYLEDRGAELIQGLNATLRSLDLDERVEVTPYRWNCMPYIQFRDHGTGAARKDAFFRTMAARGHLFLRDHMNFIMVAHTVADIRATIQAAGEVFSDLRSDFRHA